MPAPTLDQRLALRMRPRGWAMSRQAWRRLAFLHWRWDAAALAATLPPGLHLDTHEGEAWVGIVPFFMRGLRLSWLPPIRGTADFLEVNLRTYVYDDLGRPGVWFYSLDCDQPLVVRLARRFMHLPYQHAALRVGVEERYGGDHARWTATRRVAGAPTDVFDYTPARPNMVTAEPGSLEFFLLERYAMFSRAPGGRLYCGRVAHEPYRFAPAVLGECGRGLLALAGLGDPGRPPDHALCAQGFEVDLFFPRRARG